ncbi:MAG: hypothetical protein EXS05_12915 [Planctomycetaceae bacterium]|nr:hypothetical protein [Planctomycetaceae bacterium]
MRIRDPASGESWFSKRRKRYDDNRELRELTFSCGGGYDRNVTQERTLSKSPPLRKGGQGGSRSTRATDWEWSSARWYAGSWPVPFDIDATLPMTYGS